MRSRSCIGAAVAALSFAVPACAARADMPAFPGAEGFGAVATGGRGGKVVKVTTLATGGPGSLQAALDAPFARIIVFDVSGVIEGDHTIQHGDVTIAGQTAPGAGITLRGRLTGNYSTGVDNVIIRHLRIRPPGSDVAGEQFDALQLSRGSRIMLDHVDVSWGVDETVDLYEASDITVQWSIIAESAIGNHPEGEHNYGLINGPDGSRISVHHNLFAHHKNRAPAIANGPAEVRNNVMYNVRHAFVHHNPATGPFNIVGNAFIQGPTDSLIPFWFDAENNGDASLSYHLADNFVDDPGDYVGRVDNPWQQPPLHPTFADMFLPASYYRATEHDFTGEAGYVPVSTQSAEEAKPLVLEKAGAFPRDVVTKRVIDDVLHRTGQWGAQTAGDPMAGLQPGQPPADGDGDGMADAWESAHGLDPQDGGDHGATMPSGYTAIEEYINELADGMAAEPLPDPGEEGETGGRTPGDEGASNGAPVGTPVLASTGCGVSAPARGAWGWVLVAVGAWLGRRRVKGRGRG